MTLILQFTTFLMSIRIAIIALDQCLASAIAGSIDLLHAANQIGSSLRHDNSSIFDWKISSISGEPVCTSNGSMQQVDTRCSYLRRSDVIYVPGIALIDEARLVNILTLNQSVIRWLSGQATRGRLIASSCTGAFILAEAGLLDGKSATTAWPVTDLFTARYPDVALRSDQILVDSGNIITSGSANSYQDLMLAIIQRFTTEKIARLTARYMLVDQGRCSQSAYRLRSEDIPTNPLVRAAHKIIHASLDRSLPVTHIAEQLNVSERTLIRKFKQNTGSGPNTYIQNLRIDHAKYLLETTSLPHEDVAQDVGYSDTSSFRRLFKRKTGMTLGDYRKRFGNNYVM